MRKFAAVLFCVLCTFCIFAGATPEKTKKILQNLPSIVEQKSEVLTSSQTQQQDLTTAYSVIERDMSQLERLYKYVEKNYLFDIDHDKVYQAMATAMFDALGDQYSYYIEPQDSKDYAEMAMGKYGGIGITFLTNPVTVKTSDGIEIQGFQVSQVFPNSPAAKMGMVAKDVIVAVDSISASELTGNDCANHMKGDIGTSVVVSVCRGGSVFDLTLIRELIYSPTVEYEMIDSVNGYIRILEFSVDTVSKIKDALTDLTSKGMKGLAIDLRDNPGGDVDSALAIADMFISDAELLRIYHKDSSNDVIYKAGPDTVVSDDVKVVILINEGSASSSEIFSSTMRDNNRATLVGTTSFGKGIMQIVTSFGEAYISVTNARFVPPSGNPIHEEGVTPDVYVESLVLTDEEIGPYINLMQSKQAEDFIKENPQFNPANVEKFVKSCDESGLRPEVLRILIRNAYYSQMDNEPLADIVYDPQMKKAYEILLEK